MAVCSIPSYRALQGLFTAHVTGNFVTICAALVFGTSGIIAKLLALPVSASSSSSQPHQFRIFQDGTGQSWSRC